MRLAPLILALTLCTPAWAAPCNTSHGSFNDVNCTPSRGIHDNTIYSDCPSCPSCPDEGQFYNVGTATVVGNIVEPITPPQPDMSKLDVHVEHTTHGIAIVMDGSEVCPKGWMWTRHITGNSDKEGFPIVVDSCTKAK